MQKTFWIPEYLGGRDAKGTNAEPSAGSEPRTAHLPAPQAGTSSWVPQIQLGLVWTWGAACPSRPASLGRNLQQPPTVQGWPSQALRQFLCNLSLRQTAFAGAWQWSSRGTSTDPAPKNILRMLLQGISLGFWASSLYAELRLLLNLCRLRDLYLNYRVASMVVTDFWLRKIFVHHI